MTSHTANGAGLTLKELVIEIRDDVRELRGDVEDLKDRVVFKEELALYNRARVMARRYMITTLIAVGGLLVAAVSIIIGTR